MGQFVGPCILMLAEDQSGKPVLTEDGRSTWSVYADFDWVDTGYKITVQRGSPTDLASIPRPVWECLPPDGPWTKAAVLHDELYRRKGDVPRDGRAAPFTRAEADKILDDAMAALGVGLADRVAIYEAVRAGGEIGWGS